MNVDLTVDLLILEERLFVLSLDEINKLDQRMFEQTQRESYALSQLGAAYVLRFNEQRCTVDSLRRFMMSFPSYSALADGYKVYSWIRANGNQQVNYGSLLAALRAIRALDEMVPAEPPRITRQPEDQAVLAGEPASFKVEARGTALLEFQWFKDGKKIEDAALQSYSCFATEFNNGSKFTVTVSNAAGSIESNPATLRTIRK